MSIPTLQTIADLAGVSRSTVSMALRNRPNLSQETRDRVRRIADEIGYRPNPLISTLMTHLRASRPLSEQGTLAFITNFPTRDQWRDHRTFVRFFNGAKERANRNGYILEEFWLREPLMTNRRMSKILSSRGIRGAVIAPLPGKGGHLSLDLSELATVTFGLSMKRPKIHRADNNQVEAVRTAIKELKRRGYRRIGLAIEKDHDRHVSYNYTMGYLEAVYRLKAPVMPIYEPVVPTRETLFAWVKDNRPDAVMSVTTRFFGWLREQFDIPGKLGYALLDWGDLDVGIAGMDGRPELTGASAIDLLVGQINRNERGIPAAPKVMLMDGVWVDGATVRGVAFQRSRQIV